MLINKEVYTVVVLVIQYAFPLCSIVFAYSRIASRMGNRFPSQNKNNLSLSTTTNATTDKKIIKNIKETDFADNFNTTSKTAIPASTTTSTTRNSLSNHNGYNYGQLSQIAQEQRRKLVLLIL